MNKSEFVGAVASALGGTKDEAAKAVDAVLGTIAATIGKGEAVKLTGFGIFERKVRKARIARNPATGASVEVPEKRTAKFRPGKDLEARL